MTSQTTPAPADSGGTPPGDGSDGLHTRQPPAESEKVKVPVADGVLQSGPGVS